MSTDYLEASKKAFNRYEQTKDINDKNIGDVLRRLDMWTKTHLQFPSAETLNAIGILQMKLEDYEKTGKCDSTPPPLFARPGEHWSRFDHSEL